LAQLTSESQASEERIASDEPDQRSLDIPMNESGSDHRSPGDIQESAKSADHIKTGHDPDKNSEEKPMNNTAKD